MMAWAAWACDVNRLGNVYARAPDTVQKALRLQVQGTRASACALNG